jgi:hypothetical protein
MIAGATTSTNGDVVGNDGGAEFWVVKINDTGDLIWQQTYGGTKADLGFAIDNTSDNGFILAGYSWSNDGDVSGSLNRGKNDFWVVKLSPESVSTQEAASQNPNPLDIYPNPASDFVNIEIASDAAVLEVSISDLLGRELLRQPIPNGGKVDVSVLESGLYMLSAAVDGRVFWGKVEKH